MDLNIIVPEWPTDLIPNIKKEFSHLGMTIDFHPEFNFNKETDSGFCPIKLKVKEGVSNLYKNHPNELLSGFELHFGDYDYDEELNDHKTWSNNEHPKSSFISRIFRKKKAFQEEEEVEYLVSKVIDKKLISCSNRLLIN